MASPLTAPREDSAAPVRLPCSSTREVQRRRQAHVKILESVDRRAPAALGFEGRIFRPGQVLAELPDPAVVIECAGPAGQRRPGGRRDTLWLLWRYDRPSGLWIEIARAQATGWEWAMILRDPAWQALQRDMRLFDAIEHGRGASTDLLSIIDSRLSDYPRDLAISVLSALHEAIESRIATA